MAKKITSKTDNINPIKELMDMNIEQTEVMRKRIKTGGREKGTPNKVTTMTKNVILNLLSDYQDSGLMGSDFLLLPPEKRIGVATNLMSFIMPKMQSTSIDLNTDEGKITIEKKLRDLSKDPDEE